MSIAIEDAMDLYVGRRQLMEYVTVTFSKSRTVLIDGEEAGLTNKTLRVEAGMHTFKLSDPQDYNPKWRRRLVQDTTSIEPMEVSFEKI